MGGPREKTKVLCISLRDHPSEGSDDSNKNEQIDNKAAKTTMASFAVSLS